MRGAAREAKGGAVLASARRSTERAGLVDCNPTPDQGPRAHHQHEAEGCDQRVGGVGRGDHPAQEAVEIEIAVVHAVLQRQARHPGPCPGRAPPARRVSRLSGPAAHSRGWCRATERPLTAARAALPEPAAACESSAGRAPNCDRARRAGSGRACQRERFQAAAKRTAVLGRDMRCEEPEQGATARESAAGRAPRLKLPV